MLSGLKIKVRHPEPRRNPEAEKTHTPGDVCQRAKEINDYHGGRRLLRPSTQTQAKYHQPHRLGSKPTDGLLETRRGHWSTFRRRSPPEESAGWMTGDQKLEGAAD